MDNTTFEQLYLLHKSALQRYLNYKLPSKADGEDVLQEVAITAFRNMHSLKNPDSFKSWILKIASNKCNDFYRMLAKRHEIPFDETLDTVLSKCRYGISDTEIVRDVLENMGDKDKQILFLFYFKNKPQSEIAQLLDIPIGTVKSRLHTAKQNFKQVYPFPPKSKKSKGIITMKTLPNIMPEYKITPSPKPPFECKWEEMMGWFMVPKLGEKLTWAMYDFPDRKRTELYEMEVIGKASVHGIQGVEIVAKEYGGGVHEDTPVSRNITRTFIAQLTDTHCRLLAQTHEEDGVKQLYTFLDGDDFIRDWGFGEDNCGNETDLRAKGIVTKEGNNYICPQGNQVMDVVGRFDVEMNGKVYDTVCVVDSELYNAGVFSEQYIDQNGKTVLWRRYNRDNWGYNRYNKLWSEMHPNNDRITVNGGLYVHWYDCITDYVM